MPGMKVLSCNLPSDFAEAIEAWAADEGKPVSFMLSLMIFTCYKALPPGQALRKFYPRLPKEPKAKESMWDKL